MNFQNALTGKAEQITIAGNVPVVNAMGDPFASNTGPQALLASLTATSAGPTVDTINLAANVRALVLVGAPPVTTDEVVATVVGVTSGLTYLAGGNISQVTGDAPAFLVVPVLPALDAQVTVTIEFVGIGTAQAWVIAEQESVVSWGLAATNDATPDLETGQSVGLFRSDGRPYPLGALFAPVAIGSTSVTAIPAPALGGHIHIASMWMTVGGTGSTPLLQGTIDGVVQNIAVAPVPGFALIPLPHGGLLLDAATKVEAVAPTGVSLSAGINYDLVV